MIMLIVELEFIYSNEDEKLKEYVCDLFFKLGFLIEENKKGNFKFKSFDEKERFIDMHDVFDYLFSEEWFCEKVNKCVFYLLKKGQVSFYRDVLYHYFYE